MPTWKQCLGVALAVTGVFQVLLDLLPGIPLRSGSGGFRELLVEMAAWIGVLVVLWVRNGRTLRRATGSSGRPPTRPPAYRVGVVVGTLAFVACAAVGQVSGTVVGGALELSHPERAVAEELATYSGSRSTTTFVTFTDHGGVRHTATRLITESLLHDGDALDSGEPLVYARDEPSQVMTAAQYASARTGRDALLHWGSMVGMAALVVLLLRSAGRLMQTGLAG